MRPTLLSCLVFRGALVSFDTTFASDIVLQWYASPSSDVAGYNVYYGTSSGNLLYKVNAGNATSVTITNLTPGVTYYFSATAYDAAGDESQPSPQVTFLVPYLISFGQAVVPGSPVRLQFFAVTGHWYEVQMSPDLENWSTFYHLDTAVMSFNVALTDPNPGSAGSRYYRLVIH